MSLRPHFDSDSVKVYLAMAAGIGTSLSANQIVSIAVGCVTFLYILTKWIKQLRDWKKPDGE